MLKIHNDLKRAYLALSLSLWQTVKALLFRRPNLVFQFRIRQIPGSFLGSPDISLHIFVPFLSSSGMSFHIIFKLSRTIVLNSTLYIYIYIYTASRVGSQHHVMTSCSSVHGQQGFEKPSAVIFRLDFITHFYILICIWILYAWAVRPW
jgi:hypothetical protein